MKRCVRNKEGLKTIEDLDYNCDGEFGVTSIQVISAKEEADEFFNIQEKELKAMKFANWASHELSEGGYWIPAIVEICNRLKVRLDGMKDNGYPIVKTKFGFPTQQIQDLFK